MSDFMQYVNKRRNEERKITAAREAVIAAAREWYKQGEGKNVRMWIETEDALDAAVASLNRLEATDGETVP